MANEEQLKLISEGPEVWNNWRNKNPTVDVDLSGADLSKRYVGKVYLGETNYIRANLERINLERSTLDFADFNKANLTKANLSGTGLHRTDFSDVILNNANLTAAYCHGANFTSARLYEAVLHKTNLTEANFRGANLKGANLEKASLRGANLDGAKLVGARLVGADLTGAYCYKTDFSRANLTEANLQTTSLVEANLEQTILTNCKIYGLSAWGLKGKPKDQSNLIITPDDDQLAPDNEPMITVDDIQVAQFIYLLLNYENVRNVIDTITSKAVLILGRFTPERMEVLDAMASELRQHNLLPIIFKFERSSSRDFTETIKTLASLSLFVIADITDPSSAPLELQATVPEFQIPFVPIIQAGQKPFSMLNDLISKYNWVLEPVTYNSIENLLSRFKLAIIDRAWEKHQELQRRKAKTFGSLSIDDFLNQQNSTKDATGDMGF